MRLLACVCSNVTGLMLKAVKGLIAERTFVWPRQIGLLLVDRVGEALTPQARSAAPAFG